MELGELESLRGRIREVTLELLGKIKTRSELVQRAAEIKENLGIETYQAQVERELRDFLIREGKALGLSPSLVTGLATLLFQDSVRIQSKKTQGITHMDILRRGLELQRQGVEVQHLEVGEPDLGAPEEVREAVASAVRDGFARYGDSRGLLELRRKIADYLGDRFNSDVGAQNILIIPGGRFGIYLALKTLVGVGDEVILIDPSWPAYRQCVEFVGARAVGVKTRLEDGWNPDLDRLNNSISPSTKAVILNYPNNPTGKVLTRRDFRSLVELAVEKNITVISDEVYYDYSFGERTSILDGYHAKYVVIQSFSKSFGMTGYRIGYVVADKEIIERMASVISLLLTCVPEFIQHGAIKALELNMTPAQYSDIMRRRMETASRELSKLPVSYYRPEGGMYIFPRLDGGGVDIMALALELLEKKGVAIAPGSIFGGYDSFFRISLGASEESITKGIRLLGDFLRDKGMA